LLAKKPVGPGQPNEHSSAVEMCPHAKCETTLSRERIDKTIFTNAKNVGKTVFHSGNVLLKRFYSPEIYNNHNNNH
jgi:hypothetical protein